MLLECSASFVRIRISLITFTVTTRRLGLLTCNKRAWHEMDFHYIYCRQKPSFNVQRRKDPFSAGAPPRTLLGELTTLPQTRGVARNLIWGGGYKLHDIEFVLGQGDKTTT